MKADIKARWVEALRSGKYRQGTGELKNEANQFCCLGVLCEIAVEENVITPNPDGYGYLSKPSEEFEVPYTENSVLPNEVKIWAGLSEHNPSVEYSEFDEVSLLELSELNDGYHKSFDQIATLIESAEDL